MIETPKSLTAVVHVKFNYQEPEAKTPDTREIEMLSRRLNQTSSLSPYQLDLPRKAKEVY